MPGRSPDGIWAWKKCRVSILQSEPPPTRTNLQSQYNALLTQIDQLSHDSSYNGVNLLAGDNLKVTFNETGSSSLTINGVKDEELADAAQLSCE